MTERNMASWCSYHPGVSPKCLRKKKADIRFVWKAKQGTDVACPGYVSPPLGRGLAVRFPALRKALEKTERTAPWENVPVPKRTPVTVDVFDQTVGRHCLESGYIKILKTTWEGTKIISNDTCKIPQLCNAKKYISIYIYVHIHIFHS